MMKRILFLLALLSPIAAHAQTAAWNGSCDQEATSAVTSGLPSTNKLQGIVPYCTVTVYLTGTLTKATIYKDVINTPQTNPYQAPVNGKVLFYAAQNTGYDIVGSGGFAPNTYPSPFTICTDCLTGGGNAGSGLTNFAAGSLPPLFTSSVANPTTTPFLSFVLQNAGSFQFYGNFTSGIGPPSFWTLVPGPNATITANTVLGTVTINAAGCIPSGGIGTLQASNGAGGCQAAYVQVDGTNLAAPTPVNFVDTASVQWSNPSLGIIKATAIANLALQQFVQAPTSVYQTYIMYPTVGVANPVTCVAVASPQSGAIGSCGTGSYASVTWSGFSLPGSITSASIHAIIPFLVGYGLDGSTPPAYPQNTQACTGGLGAFFVTGGNVFNLGTYFQGTVPSPTTFNFSTATCTAISQNSLPLQQAGGGQVINGIGYIIQYTGTAIPNNLLQIVPPLAYSVANNSLSLPLPYNFAADTNTSTLNAYQIQLPAFQGLQPGDVIEFLPYAANTTTTPTLTVTDALYNTYSGTIIKQTGGALVANDINPIEINDTYAGIAEVIWDGQFYELQNPQTGGGGGGGGSLSGMTAGQVPIAATGSTVTSSEARAGSGAAITTGPGSGVTTLDLTEFTGTGGQIADSGILASQVVKASSPGVGIAHFAGSTQTVTSSAVNLASADVTGLLPHANIAATAVTPGSYTNVNLTIAADGSITAAANGSGAALSGQTTNCLPLATSATASTTSSIICQTGTTSVTIGGSGPTNAIALPASATPATPVAATAIYTSDASGNSSLSENGGTAARICDASNGVCAGGSQPAEIAATYIGVPSSANQVIGLVVNALATTITVPSSCTGTYGIAQAAATASTVFLIKDLTTSTTLCTLTWAISGTTAVITGSGGSVAAGDVVEFIGPATADLTLGSIAIGIHGTR
jgi:hypothetical protein